MRQITKKWYVCKVRFEKIMENGLAKKVTESYVVDAVSFAEAEANIIEEMSSYVSTGIEVEDITKAQFSEIFFTDVDTDDKWYKAKLAFITIDERSEQEKRTSVTYLVQADSLNGAIRNIDEVMGETMIEYQSMSVQEANLMDVFEVKK